MAEDSDVLCCSAAAAPRETLFVNAATVTILSRGLLVRGPLVDARVVTFYSIRSRGILVGRRMRDTAREMIEIGVATRARRTGVISTARPQTASGKRGSGRSTTRQ